MLQHNRRYVFVSRVYLSTWSHCDLSDHLPGTLVRVRETLGQVKHVRETFKMANTRAFDVLIFAMIRWFEAV